jgi:hypothetical protein
MGFEDKVERSYGRPYREIDGRSKRLCELTSSIVPRGTSFHRAVELDPKSSAIHKLPADYPHLVAPNGRWGCPLLRQLPRVKQTRYVQPEVYRL